MAGSRHVFHGQTYLEDELSHLTQNSTYRGQIGSLGDRAQEPALPLWAARVKRTPVRTLASHPDPCRLVRGVVGMQMA